MKRYALLLVLAISVAFNAFFVIGAWGFRNAMGVMGIPENRLDFHAKDLDLTDAQRRQYKTVRAKLTVALQQARPKNQADLAALDLLLAAPNPKPEELRRTLAYLAGRESEFQRPFYDSLVDLYEIADEKQKTEWRKRLQITRGIIPR